MVNYFDQFDSQTQPAATASTGANFFDQFDAPKAPGYLDRVGSDISTSLNKGAKILTEGTRNPLSAAVQIGGNAADAVFAPITEGVKSAYTSLPDRITQPINNVASKTVQVIQNTYKAGVDNLANTSIGQAIGDYGMNSPNLQSNLQGLSDIAKGAASLVALSPTSKATEIITQPVAGAGNIAGNVLSRTGQAVADSADMKSLTKQITADDIKGYASDSYQRAAESGGVLSPSVTNKFLDSANNILPQTPEGKLVLGNSPATQMVENLSQLRGKPLSLAAAQEIDEALGDSIDSHFQQGRLTKEGQKLASIQDHFRNTIENASPDDVAGGKQGFDALQNARDLWSASARQRDIEKIINRADMSDNPATSIKTGFKTLSSNPSRLRGFNENEQALINNAARTGIVGDTLKTFGSRLLPIVTAGTGGGIGEAVAAKALSSVSRSGATALQANRAAKVINAISQRPIIQGAIKSAYDNGEIAPALTAQKMLGLSLDKVGQVLRGQNPLSLKEAMSLPPNEAKQALTEMKLLSAPTSRPVSFVDEGNGTLRPQTDSEYYNAKLAASKDKSIGLTPDVRQAQMQMQATNQAALESLKRSDAWSKIDASEKEKIRSQIDRDWQQNQVPLESIIAQAKDNVESMVATKGSDIKNTALREALMGAIKNKKSK